MDAIFRNRRTLEFYRGLGIADHLDATASRLLERGHTRYTIRGVLMSLRRVALFLEANEIDLVDLRKPGTVQRFRERWLSESRATYGRLPKEDAFRTYRRAIEHLLQTVYGIGIESPVEPDEPLPEVAEEFLQFQKVHRGLSTSALHSHEYYLRALMVHLQNHGMTDLIDLPIGVLDAFVSELSGKLTRGGMRNPVWLLRAFLGYLFFTGREPRDRSSLVASPTTFREMTLPKHLSEVELQQALGLVDRTTATGKRDWAIFMVFCCLGLRADEVRRLRLDDLDRDTQTLRVQRAKGGGTQVFPLTPPLREALDIYLEEARPAVDCPEIFLTVVAPFRPFRNGGSLSAVVSRYLRKVPGLNAHGSHVLRHTLARRLRKAGAPLGIIRRTLGHANTDTTQLYLRIAFEELREVADNYADLL